MLIYNKILQYIGRGLFLTPRKLVQSKCIQGCRKEEVKREMSIIDSLRNLNFGFNELKYFLFALVLVLLMTLVIRKIARALKAEAIVDERLRGTRARIARSLTEIVENPDRSPKEAVNTIKNSKQTSLIEDVPIIQEASEVAPKGKKTREMSAEERWADFDRKRSMRSSA